MNFITKLFRKIFMGRLWDFEGRCVKCHKSLNMKLRRIHPHKIQLKVEPCKYHPNPDDSVILWPQRDDIIDEDDFEFYLKKQKEEKNV